MDKVEKKIKFPSVKEILEKRLLEGHHPNCSSGLDYEYGKCTCGKDKTK